jgi:hypothetical protein
MLAHLIVVAVVVLLMVKVRDYKFNSLPCAICGRRGKHSLDCPGSR